MGDILNDIIDSATRAPKGRRSAGIPIVEAIILLIPHLMTAIINGRVVAAADLLDEEPEYQRRDINAANPVGDVIGARGFGLYRSTRGVECSFRNARLVLKKSTDHDRLAKQIGYESKDDLLTAVFALGFRDSDLTKEQRTQIVAALGYDDEDALIDAAAALPAPSYVAK